MSFLNLLFNILYISSSLIMALDTIVTYVFYVKLKSPLKQL